MKRKLLSLILVVAMLASMAIFVPAASATENVATVKTTNAVGSAGDEVTVDVTITVDSFAGFQLAFVYDSSRLTYNGVSYDQTGSSFAPAGAAQNQQFVNYGPYTLIGRAWQDAEGNTFLFENCEDTKFATLSFTIKEDAPAGDAYVEFCSLNGVYNDAAYRYDKVTRSAQLGITDDILYESSVVTVLPEGYSSESVVPQVNYITQDDVDEMRIEYEMNDAETGVIITNYDCSYTGIVVIPSSIVDSQEVLDGGTYPVVGIGPRAFNTVEDATGFVIPESVTELSNAAFYRCTASDYYVLNSDCVIGEGAMGAGGTASSKGVWTVDKGPWVIETVAGTAATIHGVAGSTAQTYAETGFEAENTAFPGVTVLGWSATTDLPTECTMSFNGDTYYFLTGSDVTVPGTAVVDGKTVVAWTDGENTYAAGATVTLTESLVLEPVTITAPVTSTEVDFKLAAKEEDLAMRFTATLSKDDYATLASLGTVKLGMLITPAKRVAQAGSFTKEALDALTVTHKYVDIAIDGYYKETTDDYILAGSLKGFSASTLANNPDFAAIVYATVTTAGGDTFTVYGDFNFDANQDVKSVAEAIVETNITSDQETWLNTLIGKFSA